MAQRRLSTKLELFAKKELLNKVLLMSAVWLPLRKSSVVPRTLSSRHLSSILRPSQAKNSQVLPCLLLSPAYVPVNSTIIKENSRLIQLCCRLAVLSAF